MTTICCLMLFNETSAIYSENHAKPTNTKMRIFWSLKYDSFFYCQLRFPRPVFCSREWAVVRAWHQVVGLQAVVPTPERLRWAGNSVPESFRRPVNNLLRRQKRLLHPQLIYLSTKVSADLYLWKCSVELRPASFPSFSAQSFWY